MIRYYAKIVRQRDTGYVVEFPDLPGCLTEGRKFEDAQKNAKEALSGWLASHCDRFMDVPKPIVRRGRFYHPIDVDIHVEFALRLRELRKEKGLSQKDIAKKLGVSQQAYAKLEIPHSSNPSLTTIQRLCEALDVEIDIKMVA